LAKLSESVNDKLGSIVTENRCFKDQMTKDMEANAKVLVAHELTTFRERV
jgi:hypothetical protein